jgi:hypothetical protein
MSALDSQYLLYCESRDKELHYCLVIHKDNAFFQGVIRRISRKVLRLVDEQLMLYKKRVEDRPVDTDEYNCSSTLWTTIGILCSHMLGRRLRRQNIAERTITINDFAKQWWVDPNDINPPAAIERQPLVIEINSDDEDSGDSRDGGDSGNRVQQERTRLIQLATTRILNATPA